MSSALGVFLMVFAPLAAFAQAASPPPDWIDEFPSVTEVAHAAFEEMKVTAARRNLDNTGDDDAVAINLAGTFVVLRQIMFMKYNEEPPMATDREEKLKKLVASYEEAELTIGRGWAGRSGYIKRAAPTGLGCGDESCYRRWFLLHLNASSGRAEYRRRVLNRLFPCGALAKELDELRQKHATTVPYMPSPAATVRIDPALAGIGPSGCSAYGGDSRQSGLCDGWMPPPAGQVAPTPAVAAAPAPAGAAPAGAPASGAFRKSASGCLIIALTQVRMAKNGALLVSIAPTSANAGDVVTFRVWRSTTEAPDASPAIWEQQATLTKGSSDLQGVVATGASLAPDPARPFLVVDTTSTRSRGPAQCEQPTTKWEQRPQPKPNVLHGPYPSVDEAALNDHASTIARHMTGAGGPEHGFTILRRKSKPEYYVTPSLASSSGSAGGAAQPQFLSTDYRVSVERAFETSCENADEFTIAAIVHTHPNKWPAPSMFTTDDYHQAIQLEGYTHQCPNGADDITQWFCANARGFELTVMIDMRDGQTRTFRACPKDQGFAPLELTAGHTDLAFWLIPKWWGYRDRTDVISGSSRSRNCPP